MKKKLDNRTKLTDAQVSAMRKRYAAGFTRGKPNAKHITMEALAEDFGVSRRHTVNLLTKKARA